MSSLLNIDDVRNLTYLTNYHWKVDIITPPPAVPIDSKAFDIRCATVTHPVADNMKLTIWLRMHRTFQPGHIEYNGSLDFVFNETVDHQVAQWITAWREACFQTKTGIQLPKDQVSATIRLIRLNRSVDASYNYTLYGCFLEKYEMPELQTAEQKDIFKPKMTISYDYFDEEKQ